MSRRRVGIVILAALAIGWTVTAAGLAPSERAGRLAREIVESGRYQTDLPEPDEPESPDAVSRWDIRPAGVGIVAWALLIAVMVAVAGLLAVGIVHALPAWRRESARADAPDAPAATTVGGGGSSAVALAESGRFAEAIHALLLDALRLLSRRARLHADPSWTSREVLAHLSVDPDRRRSLGRLLGAAERIHFGGEPAEAADWEISARQFRNATGEEPA